MRALLATREAHAGVVVDGRVEAPFSRAVVYYAYDNRHQLLYVGTSTNLIARLGNHAATSVWWAHVSRVDWIDFASADEARAYESLEIAALNPPFNKAGRT